MGRLFTSGGQIIGALAPILQQNIQGWFPLGLTGLISLQSKGVSSVFSSTTVQKHQFFGAQTNSLWFSSHICTWLLEKPHLWQCRPSSAKWCFCFEYTIYVCHIFLSKEQVSFNFMAAVAVCSDFGAQENKICSLFPIFSPLLPLFPLLFVMKSWDQMPWSYCFECWAWSQLFHSPLSPLSGGKIVPLHFLPLEWYHLYIWGCWYFSWKTWFQLVIHLAWHFTWYTLHGGGGGLVTELCPALATPWTVACQVPLSIGFSRQDWSGLPFPSPGVLPNPGI